LDFIPVCNWLFLFNYLLVKRLSLTTLNIDSLFQTRNLIGINFNHWHFFYAEVINRSINLTIQYIVIHFLSKLTAFQNIIINNDLLLLKKFLEWIIVHNLFVFYNYLASCLLAFLDFQMVDEWILGCRHLDWGRHFCFMLISSESFLIFLQFV